MKRVLPIITLVLSCSSMAQLPTGEVIDSVFCSHDKSQSYSLYLPSNYSEEKSWPIIYFFEPAARGQLPVKKYHTIAEEFGFILVGSNNSRNGSWEDSFNAADAVLHDTQNKLSLDKDRFYLSGFSGGSRLVLSMAVLTDRFDGVIGVGAAQPPLVKYQVQKKHDFLYVGLVGNRDMNYLEHKKFSEHLDNLGNQNLLIVSNKKHQWASVTDFRLALIWILKKRDKNKEEWTSDTWADEHLMRSDSVSRIDQNHLKERFSSLPYLDVAYDKKEIKLKREEKRLFDKEYKEHKILRDSMSLMYVNGQRNTSIMRWLKNKIDGYKKWETSSKKLATRFMYSRILDQLRARSIETAMRWISQPTNLAEAQLYVEVYEMVSGSSVYSNWWFAKIHALNNDSEKSLEHIQEMIKMGFKNREILRTDVAFQNLKSNQKFQELIGKPAN